MPLGRLHLTSLQTWDPASLRWPRPGSSSTSTASWVWGRPLFFCPGIPLVSSISYRLKSALAIATLTTSCRHFCRFFAALASSMLQCVNFDTGTGVWFSFGNARLNLVNFMRMCCVCSADRIVIPDPSYVKFTWSYCSEIR